MRILTSILFTVLMIIVSCKAPNEKQKIVGVKTYTIPKNAKKTVKQWKRLNINTAFISKELAFDKNFIDAAQNENIQLFLIAPVFFNPEALQKHKEWYAIQSNGDIAKDDWVEFICPSQTTYINLLIDSLKTIVASVPLDGISIDFIRHFLYWEQIEQNTNPDSIPNTCFCNRCITNFEGDINQKITRQNTADKASFILKNYPKEWSLFKQNQIEKTLQKIVTAVKSVKPNIKINLHAIPWVSNDFNGSVYSKAGQNIASLEKYCDYISPMVYHHMTHHSTEWISEVIETMNHDAPGKILPCIQVSKAYRTQEISAKEFANSITHAKTPVSQGIVFWSWEYLEKNKEKQILLQHIALE